MKRFLLLLSLFAAYVLVADAQPSPGQLWITASSAPSGACAAIYGVLVIPTGSLYTCQTGTWAQVSGGSGGASPFFGNITAVSVASSATPAFSLAAVSSQSPILFQISPTTNVTGPTITNPSKGALFYISVTTDGTHTWSWNSIASNVCPIYTAAAATTTALLQVLDDGSTITGRGCWISIGGMVFYGAAVSASSTAPGSGNMDCRVTLAGLDCYDGTNHWIQIEGALGTGVNAALQVNVGTAGAPVVNGGVLGTPSSGSMANLTGLTAAQIPAVNLPTPGATCTFTANSTICVATTTATITVPVPAAGYQFCVLNDDNVSTVITLSAIGSSARYENTARTAYGTAGTGTFVSGGAVGDAVCLLGRDSTHYLTVSYSGAWTAN
jgi:hypothetical protein